MAVSTEEIANLGRFEFGTDPFSNIGFTSWDILIEDSGKKYYGVEADESVYVKWGDGSGTSSSSQSHEHQYDSTGQYTVTIYSLSGFKSLTQLWLKGATLLGTVDLTMISNLSYLRYLVTSGNEMESPKGETTASWAPDSVTNLGINISRFSSRNRTVNMSDIPPNVRTVILKACNFHGLLKDIDDNAPIQRYSLSGSEFTEKADGTSVDRFYTVDSDALSGSVEILSIRNWRQEWDLDATLVQSGSGDIRQIRAKGTSTKNGVASLFANQPLEYGNLPNHGTTEDLSAITAPGTLYNWGGNHYITPAVDWSNGFPDEWSRIDRSRIGGKDYRPFFEGSSQGGDQTEGILGLVKNTNTDLSPDGQDVTIEMRRDYSPTYDKAAFLIPHDAWDRLTSRSDGPQESQFNFSRRSNPFLIVEADSANDTFTIDDPNDEFGGAGGIIVHGTLDGNDEPYSFLSVNSTSHDSTNGKTTITCSDSHDTDTSQLDSTSTLYSRS